MPLKWENFCCNHDNFFEFTNGVNSQVSRCKLTKMISHSRLSFKRIKIMYLIPFVWLSSTLLAYCFIFRTIRHSTAGDWAWGIISILHPQHDSLIIFNPAYACARAIIHKQCRLLASIACSHSKFHCKHVFHRICMRNSNIGFLLWYIRYFLFS